MNLYVWTDFCPDYTGGLAFAIADGIEEAQKLVTEDYGMNVYEWGELHVFPLTHPIAFAVPGGG